MSVGLRRWIALSAVVLVPMYASANTIAHQPAKSSVRKTKLHSRTTWDSVFTAAQVTRGLEAYGRTCSRCHQASLGGADESPALTGGAFMSNWNGQTLGEMHERVRTSMPTDTPGTYSRKDVADVIAYILSVNGFPAGTLELPTDDDALRDIVFSARKP